MRLSSGSHRTPINGTETFFANTLTFSPKTHKCARLLKPFVFVFAVMKSLISWPNSISCFLSKLCRSQFSLFFKASYQQHLVRFLARNIVSNYENILWGPKKLNSFRLSAVRFNRHSVDRSLFLRRAFKLSFNDCPLFDVFVIFLSFSNFFRYTKITLNRALFFIL